MNCNCDKAPEFPTPAFIPGPVEIPINYRAVTIPADQGDDTTNPPLNGAYRNVILKYAANNHVYIYSSDGIPVMLVGAIDFDEIANRPKYDGQPMTSGTNIPDLTDEVSTLQSEVQALATDFSYKGSVADYAHLPTDAATGDVYTTTDTGIIYVWDGNAWVALNEYPSVFVGTDGTNAGEEGLVPAPTAADAGKVLGADGTWVTGGPNVVQSTGTSTTSVMSQDATTNMLWRDPTTKKTIQYNTYYYSGSWEGNDNNNIYLGARQILGQSGDNTLIGHVITGSSANKSVAVGNNQSVKDNTVAIGYKTWVFGDSRGSSSVSIGSDIGTVTDLSVIIGSNASIFGYAAPSTTKNSTVTIGCASQTSGKSAVAVGFAAAASQQGEFSIGLGGLSNNGSSQLNYGHNGSSYRLLSGVDTPQDDHDAATKSYVDANSPTVFTTNEWNALWA